MRYPTSSLLLIAIFAALQGCNAVISRGTPVQGFATFYGGPQDGLSPTQASYGLVNGACGYTALSQQDWPYWNVVSIGPNNPVAYKGNKKGCGYCIQASCVGSSCGADAKAVTLWVTDACDTCAPNQLNLHALAFQNNFNQDLGVGRVNITFEQVDCMPPGNILAKVVKSRPTQGNYIGFALMAVAGEGTIASVEIQGQGATWQRMVNNYGDVWEGSNFGDAPLSIRVTDNYGVTLTATNAITAIAEGTYDLGIQYPLGTQTASPTSAPVPSPSPVAEANADFGPGFLSAPAGEFCDKECFSQGLTASQFKKLGTTTSTFACGVDSSADGVLAGYQLSNGSATCSVASASSAQDSSSYSCLCQSQAQTQGLEPYNGTECSQACAISIDGLSGASVEADAQGKSSVCLPLAETSLLNRFGHTVTTSTGEACVIDAGGQSQPSSQFSCFCLFTAPVASSRRRLLM